VRPVRGRACFAPRRAPVRRGGAAVTRGAGGAVAPVRRCYLVCQQTGFGNHAIIKIFYAVQTEQERACLAAESQAGLLESNF
jgi:hypothetical protein